MGFEGAAQFLSKIMKVLMIGLIPLPFSFPSEKPTHVCTDQTNTFSWIDAQIILRLC